jgi:hypothetical protein
MRHGVETAGSEPALRLLIHRMLRRQIMGISRQDAPLRTTCRASTGAYSAARPHHVRNVFTLTSKDLHRFGYVLN